MMKWTLFGVYWITQWTIHYVVNICHYKLDDENVVEIEVMNKEIDSFVVCHCYCK